MKSNLFKKKYPKLLGSSVDPYKLASTWRGILKSVAAVALSLSPFLNVSVEDINTLFDSLDQFLAGLDTATVSVLAVWGLLQTVLGAARKIRNSSVK